MLTELLASLANRQIIVIGNNADLIHQANLLLIVAGKRLGTGVDVWKEAEEGIDGHGLCPVLGDSDGGSRHDGAIVHESVGMLSS